jgi:hypothetical protein
LCFDEFKGRLNNSCTSADSLSENWLTLQDYRHQHIRQDASDTAQGTCTTYGKIAVKYST